jgi:uncharacterized membrane-anchored protein
MSCPHVFSILTIPGFEWGWTPWDIAFRILVGIIGGFLLYLRYKNAYLQARKVKRSPKVTKIELIIAIVLWALIGGVFLIAFAGGWRRH